MWSVSLSLPSLAFVCLVLSPWVVGGWPVGIAGQGCTGGCAGQLVFAYIGHDLILRLVCLLPTRLSRFVIE